MKTQELLLACFVVAGLAGAGSAVAAHFLLDDGPRMPSEPDPRVQDGVLADASPELDEFARELDALRMENAELEGRLVELENRLVQASARTPIEEPVQLAGRSQLSPADVAAVAATLGSGGDEITPAFVASVDRALAEIRAKEEAERQEKRKELQAERIEERLIELREKLGLGKSQVQDLRTALLEQDDKREALFASMREEGGDRRTVFEDMRNLRDETHATLQTFLTPQQFTAYRETEESEFRRGFGGFPREGRDGGAPGDPAGRSDR